MSDARNAAPPHLKSSALAASSLRHGFFGRAGGVSTGMFASLNAGRGSSDEPGAVNENRARCAAVLNVEPAALLTLYQIHSPEVVIVREPWSGAAPKADAMVSNSSGVALGVLAADCMPFLLADAEAGVIAAAHAGWRGALAGVLEATVKAMTGLGARPAHIAAALGPCLRQPNFEVGDDLVEAFTGAYPSAKKFFIPGAKTGKSQFDLAGFGRWRLAEAGVDRLDDLGVCTLARPDDYFSYRASRRKSDDDYGRNISAIALTGAAAG